MTSLRHNRSAADARDDYLDAARDCILDVGWRRSTLTEVARRAGVSRMTIYRTWTDMNQLLGDLMTREWTQVAATTHQGDGLPGSRADLARTMVRLVGALRSNDLFVRIVELDPELLLTYLLARRGRSQEALIAVLAEAVRHGQAGGWVRAGNPVLIARGLVLAGHGHVMSAQTMLDDDISLTDLDSELTLLVERTLAP